MNNAFWMKIHIFCDFFEINHVSSYAELRHTKHLEASLTPQNKEALRRLCTHDTHL